MWGLVGPRDLELLASPGDWRLSRWTTVPRASTGQRPCSLFSRSTSVGAWQCGLVACPLARARTVASQLAVGAVPPGRSSIFSRLRCGSSSCSVGGSVTGPMPPSSPLWPWDICARLPSMEAGRSGSPHLLPQLPAGLPGPRPRCLLSSCSLPRLQPLRRSILVRVNTTAAVQKGAL